MGLSLGLDLDLVCGPRPGADPRGFSQPPACEVPLM